MTVIALVSHQQNESLLGSSAAGIIGVHRIGEGATLRVNVREEDQEQKAGYALFVLIQSLTV
jgi:hypothetical protein